MLAALTIENILLLKSCRVDFAPGLNVLTGETGAGKSILLDALGLALGERSETGLIREGEARAQVVAEFDAVPQAAAALLETLGIAAGSPLIIRRDLTAQGKSRAFVNDTPITVAALRQLGALLVVRHGQHDQRGLLDIKTHRDLLDQAAAHAPLVTTVADAYHALTAARAAHAALIAEVESAAREEEWLRRSVDELQALAPLEGEEERLLSIRKAAGEGQAQRAALADAIARLSGEDGLAIRLRALLMKLGKVASLPAAISDALARAEAEIESASIGLEALEAGASLSPQEIEAAEDRLHTLRSAARKYNCAVALLPDLAAQLTQRLAQLDQGTDALTRVEKQLGDARAQYLAVAERLSASRQAAGERVCKAIARELAALRMERTLLRVRSTALAEQSWGEGGHDAIQFEIATNGSQNFGPLAKVASGGELSRLLLAMKVVLSPPAGIVSIFDEIDTGTGGAVAEAIGRRLQQLARRAQVVVVTHLPQVAALADHHLYIEKTGRRTSVTAVRTLNEAARAEELARMLSGAAISEEARQTAARLLSAAAT